VAYHDPHIPVIRKTREHPHWAGTKSVAWDAKTVSGFDAVLIATAHGSMNFQELADWAQLIVDTRNAMAGIKTADEKVWKA
jgi:UDP-N-acetyl-D-glucosamine dehydrogenase